MSAKGTDPANHGDIASRPRAMERMLAAVERAGNRLPDPVTLFVILILVLMALSAVLASFGVSAVNPATGERVQINNLFSAAYLQRLIVEMPQTFSHFPPFATVLVAMLGVGVAEKSGLIAASLSAFVRRAPRRLLAPALVFAGVMSSLAVDAGYVVLIPLGAVLFLGAGRHPIAGLAAAFAGVSAGFGANLLLTPGDALLAGISESAAQIVDAVYRVPITANYYLMLALVPLFVILGSWVTERVIEPRLGAYDPAASGAGDLPEAGDQAVGPEAVKRGLRFARNALIASLVVLGFLTVPDDAALRGPDGNFDPFLRALVSIIFIVFLVAGIAYGKGAGTIRNDRDVVRMAGQAMSDLGLYVVLAFTVAHFIALFTWSNLGVLAAVGGSEGLGALGLTGVPLVVGLVLLTAVINIFVGSAAAKWALLAPTFVPMMMFMGYTPEFTQGAYRIGDAFTNIVTPLLPYFPMVIVFARRYVPDFGIGSLIAVMLPHSIAFGLGSTLLLVIWMLLGIDLGPGSPVLLPR